MPEIQKVSIALTGEQVTALKAAVETGEYATPARPSRGVARMAVEARSAQRGVEAAPPGVAGGKASGPAVALDLAETRKEARRRLKKAEGQAA